MFPCAKAVGLNKETEALKSLRAQQFASGSGYDDDCHPCASMSEKAGETLSCFTLSWVTSDMSAALELLPAWLKPCLAQGGDNEVTRVFFKGDEGAGTNSPRDWTLSSKNQRTAREHNVLYRGGLPHPRLLPGGDRLHAMESHPERRTR